MTAVRPPTDDEIRAMVLEYGVPVRVTVGDQPGHAIGWLDDTDGPDYTGAIAEMLRAAAAVLDEDDG